MAKKKKHHRKKSVYRQQPRPAQGAARSSVKDDQVEPEAQTSTNAPVSTAAQSTKPDKKLQTLGSSVDAKRSMREVRHSLILAGVIFIGLAALWALFTFTKLGPTIYSTFKL